MLTYKIQLVNDSTKIETLMDICEEAIKNIPFLSISPDPAQVYNVLVSMKTGSLSNQAMFVLYFEDIPVGIILGTIATAHPILGSSKIAYELAWYVTPEHRGTPESMELKSSFENWAKMIGARAVVMAHFDNDVGHKLGQLYQREGYKLAELTYIKEF